MLEDLRLVRSPIGDFPAGHERAVRDHPALEPERAESYGRGPRLTAQQDRQGQRLKRLPGSLTLTSGEPA